MMEMTSAACMKQEMEEMALLLREIQGGARDLYEPATKRTLEKRRLTGEQKREKSASPWAKSTTNRSRKIMTDKEILPDNNLNADVAKSEQVVNRRAASYSFGRRYPDGQKAEIGDLMYDVNIDAASNRKRVKSSKFSTAVRPSDRGNSTERNSDVVNTNKHQNVKSDNSDIDNASDEDGAENENKSKKRIKNERERENTRKPPKSCQLEPSAKAYSFPKSSRETVEKRSAAGVSGDVDSAEKRLHPHIMGAIMRPQSATRRVPNNDALPDDQNTVIMTSNSPDIMSHLDALSSRVRTPSYAMHPDTVKKMNPSILDREKGTPGPGDYDVDPPSQSEPKGGHVYKERTKVTKAYLLAETIAPKGVGPGPGQYEVESAEKYLDPAPPSVKYLPTPSEAKKTPQLIKKHYWEEKARDARDENDDLYAVNDSVLRSRVPSAGMWVQGLNMNPKNKRILRERLAEKEKEKQGVAYEVSHALVERRIQGKVVMAKEMEAIESAKKILLQKPGVVRANVERKISDLGRDKFYGPNLPVAWGKDLVPKRGKVGPVTGVAGDDDGDDSPTEDVLRFLGDRNKTKYETENNALIVSETASAYLRSSLASGGIALKSKFNTMRQDKPTVGLRASLAACEADKDFIGGQLQVDWLSHVDSKNKNIDMKFDKGRDELMIVKKGQVLVRMFGDAEDIRTKGDGVGLGPGMYDVTTGRGIADGAGVKGLPFSLAIPRNEQVGPNGERPEYLEEELALALGEKYLRSELLAHDFGEAKDSNPTHSVRAFELYRTERNEAEKPKDPAHEKLGGTWFEGMADRIAKQPPTVSIARMTGRTDQDDPFGDSEGGTLDQGLELNITDYKPSMPRVIHTVFSDPDKNPRFEEFIKGGGKDEDSPDSISPKYTTQDKNSYAVDMGKQSGREQIISGVKREENRNIEQEIYGFEDAEANLKAEMERENGVERGLFLARKYKKPILLVDYSKQTVGRGAVSGNTPIVDGEGNLIYEKHKLDLDLNTHDDGWNKPVKGIEDWKKQTGRDDEAKGAAGTLDRILESEQLDFEPNDAATSKYRRDYTGVKWGLDKTPRPGGSDLIEKELKESEDGKMYNMHDEKNGREIEWGAGKGVVSWTLDQPKGAALMSEYLLDPLLEEEHLDIEPKLSGQSKYERLKGGPGFASSIARDTGKAKGKDVDENETQTLKLQIDDTFKHKRVLGGPGFASSIARDTGKAKGKDVDENETQTLKLQIDDTFKHKRALTGPGFESAVPRDNGLEKNVREGEGIGDGKHALDLEVDDTFKRSRLKGGPGFESAVPRDNGLERNVREGEGIGDGKHALDLEVDDTFKQKRLKGGPGFKSGIPRDNGAAGVEGEGRDVQVDEKQTLKLEVDDKFKRKKVLGGSMSQNIEHGGVPKRAGGGGDVDVDEQQTLKLEVDDNFQKKNLKGGSMSQNFDTTAAGKGQEDDVDANEKQTLKLEVDDKFQQRRLRLKGGPGFKSGIPRDNSAAGGGGEGRDVQVDEKQTLKLEVDDKFRQTRVLGGSMSQNIEHGGVPKRAGGEAGGGGDVDVDEQQTLKLEVDDNFQKRRVMGGSMSQNFDTTAAGKVQGNDVDADEKQTLKLEVDDKFKRKKVLGGSMSQNIEHGGVPKRAGGEAGGGGDVDVDEQQTLKLEVDDKFKRGSLKGGSMSQNFDTTAAGKVQGSGVDADEKQTLKLEVDDKFKRKKVKGGSMANAVQSDRKSNSVDNALSGDEEDYLLKLQVDDTFKQKRLMGGSMSSAGQVGGPGLDPSGPETYTLKLEPNDSYTLTRGGSGSVVRFRTADIANGLPEGNYSDNLNDGIVNRKDGDTLDLDPNSGIKKSLSGGLMGGRPDTDADPFTVERNPPDRRVSKGMKSSPNPPLNSTLDGRAGQKEGTKENSGQRLKNSLTQSETARNNTQTAGAVKNTVAKQSSRDGINKKGPEQSPGPGPDPVKNKSSDASKAGSKQSESRIMKNVSRAVKKSKNNDVNSYSDTEENDPQNALGSQYSPPQLYAPPVVSTGPPDFSPDELSRLDGRLKALHLK